MDFKAAFSERPSCLVKGWAKSFVASITIFVAVAFSLNTFGQAPGSVDPDYNPVIVGSAVYATVVQPNGQTIIAGSFTSVNGVPRSNIARFEPNGTLDATFDPNVNGDVWSVAVQANGDILLGGGFTTVGGAGCNNLARVHANGALDPDFNPNVNGIVYSVAVQANDDILLGGSFTTVGGTGRNRIARVGANGALDPVFNPNANDRVQSVAVQANGDILLGGNFTTVGGIGRNHIARVNANGALDPVFHPNADKSVQSVAVQADGDILLVGIFGIVDGIARNGIALVHTNGALDPVFSPDLGPFMVSLALQADGQFLCAGRSSYVARVAANGTLDQDFNKNTTRVDGRVYSVAMQANGQILLGGSFTAVGGTARNLFARLLNDPATQTLSATNGTQVQWLRGGAAPEVSQVTFELSTDGGTNYTPLAGTAARVGNTANWQVTGLALPLSGRLRARGRTTNGNGNGSSGLVETIVSYPLGDLPQIKLEQPVGTDLTDGTASVGFGPVVVGSTTDLVFTVKNTGTADLTLVGTPKVALSGTDAALFTVTSQPVASVEPGGSTTFTVRFAPVSPGAKTAALSIINNDSSRSPFDVAITGTGALLTPTFNSATDIGVTSDGFSTTGIAMGPITLNFAPVPGTNLRLVNNTSLSFINGTFSNLAQGQAVPLIFGGITYNFVANYFGGTGNDLVLQWSDTRLMELTSFGWPPAGWAAQAKELTVPLAGKTVIAAEADIMGGLVLCSDGTLVHIGLGRVLSEEGELAGRRVIAMTAGHEFGLALCADGALVGWGDNNYGQVGNGNTEPAHTPELVVTTTALAGKTVIAIAAGRLHSLALCSDGTVAAWGLDADGQLGNDSVDWASDVPVAVNTEAGSALHGKTVIAVAAGSHHSLALCSDGTLAT